MITHLLYDTIPQGHTKLVRAGLPVCFVDWVTGVRDARGQATEGAEVATPTGEHWLVPAAVVSSGFDGPEETLSVLADQTGIQYNTLVKAAREGRVLARKSGATWLSTKRAIEYALSQGTIRGGAKE
jgi:hypothetical protein